LLAIDVPSIVAAYNDGLASLRQAEEVAAALQQALGAELDLPLIRENVADALQAVDDLTAPFKEFSVAANATMADVEQQLKAAGFSVEYAGEVVDSNGDLLRVRWQRGLNSSPSFSFESGAGFAYLDPANDVQGQLKSGGLTASLAKASVEFVFGIDQDEANDAPTFFIETGGGLRFSGLSASGLVDGNLGIGYLLNVDADAKLAADLSGELILHTTNSDSRLRIEDLAGPAELRTAFAGKLSGAVTLEGDFSAKTPLIPAGISWGVKLGVDFKDGQAVPRPLDEKALIAPSVDKIQAVINAAIDDARSVFDLFGGLGTSLNDPGIKVPVPAEGSSAQSLSELLELPGAPQFKVSEPITLETINQLIRGERVDLALITATASPEPSKIGAEFPLASLPFTIGPIPAEVRLSAEIGASAGYTYYAGIGIDTVGVYIDPRTNFTLRGTANAGLVGKGSLAGWDAVSVNAGVGLELSGRVGVVDPDPSDGRIYVGELFPEEVGADSETKERNLENLAAGLLTVMDVSLGGSAHAYAKATLHLPKLKIFGKTIGGDRTLFNEQVQLGEFSTAIGQDKPAERPSEQTERRQLPTPKDKTLRAEWFQGGVLTLDAESTNGEVMTVNVRQLGSGETEVNWVGVGKSAYANLTKIKFVGSDEGDWLRVADDVVVAIDADGRGGDDQLYGGSAIDNLSGGQGNDYLSGGAGDDTLNGGEGDDYISGGDGVDTIDGGNGHDQLHGDGHDDTLRAGAGNDFLDGGAGDDNLWGGTGQDVLQGGTGDDRLFGEADNDRLFGGDGHDHLAGGTGDDLLIGGSENDTLIGGAGKDRLLGEGGTDTLWGDDAADDSSTGAPGDDVLDGGAGDDTLHGGAGDDQLVGGLDHDTLHGNEGHDELDGGAGDDKLFGDRGNDRLRGGGGADDLDGGENDDILIIDFATIGPSVGGTLVGGSGRDALEIAGTVREFDEQGKRLLDPDGFATIDENVVDWITLDQSGADQFRAERVDPLTGAVLSSFQFTLDGSTSGDIEVLSIAGLGGDDKITVLPGVKKHVTLDGGEGNDILTGGGGNDVIYGGLGSDTLFGGEGDDVLYGGERTDSAGGQAGADNDTSDDTLNGDGGNDVLYGGAGSDTMDGGEGRDVQDGGAGNDVISAGGGSLGDVIAGGAGDDIITGGDGNDVLRGGEHNDTIRGAGGADVIEGGEGDDLLYGGRGRDVIIAGAGNDRLYAVDETMFDGDPQATPLAWLDHQAAALVRVQEFIDMQRPIEEQILVLEADLKLLPPYSSATPEEAELRGALETELARLTRLSEQLSDEKLVTINQAFLDGDLRQSMSVDVLIGDAGHDHLFGSQFADTLSGGDGDDFLHFSGGNDVLSGGNNTPASGSTPGGQDRLVFRGTEGDDKILAYARPSGDTGNLDLQITMNDRPLGGVTALPKGSDVEAIRIETLGGNDEVQLDFGVNAFAVFEIDGGDGDDRLVAGKLNAWFENGAPYQGNVVMWGREGNDILIGGAGDDELRGNEGHDFIHAGKGNDVAFGHNENDIIFGGPGEDRLFGGQGDDVLISSTIYSRNPETGELDLSVTANRDDSDDYLYGDNGDDLLIGDRNNKDYFQMGLGGLDRAFGDAGPDSVGGEDDGRGNIYNSYAGDVNRSQFHSSYVGSRFDVALLPSGHDFFRPVANAGGPYAISEGERLVLDARLRQQSATDPRDTVLQFFEDGAGSWSYFGAILANARYPSQPIEHVQWTVRVNNEVRATYDGAKVELAWSDLQLLGVKGNSDVLEVSVRVRDTLGRTAQSQTTPVDLWNSPPTATFAAPLAVTTGLPFLAELKATDPSSADQAAGFTWQIDWGNGLPVVVTDTKGFAELRHTFDRSDDYLVTATATDKDGGKSAPVQRLILARRLAGDADGNDQVDLGDFGLLKQHFGSANSDVRHGDFTRDGKVDLTDFGILKENFGRRASALEPAAARAALAPNSHAAGADQELLWQAALHLAFAQIADDE
jgi:Ca2+-binding RTX toxin-like protein